MMRTLILLWMTCVSVWAVNLGDSQQAVKTELGRPTAMRKEGTLQVYEYRDGVKVSFESGVVVAVVDAGGKLLAGEVERGPERVVPPKAVEPSVQRKPVEPAPRPAPVIRESSEPLRVDVPATRAPVRVEERGRRDAFPLLAVVGLGLLVIFQLWFIVEAFSESALWGLGVLFVPVVSLVFTIAHWERAKKPFLLSLLVATPIIILAGLKG